MKHIAIRSLSVRNPELAFTAPGLGDRVHIILCAWSLSQAWKEEIVVHLTFDKWDKNKPNSFHEIIELFPAKSVKVIVHPVSKLSEEGWLSYLKMQGVDAEIFYYKDHLGWYENPINFDISPYLRKLQLLVPEKVEINLPEKFITTQWDSSGSSRMLGKNDTNAILNEYKKMGFEVITIGGMAESENMRNSLKDIAFAMSKAELHVGIDSGFMHLAQLYMKPNKIHLYHKREGWWSHHILRAIDNGSPINVYFERIRFLNWIEIKLRYDNKIARRLYSLYRSIKW